MMKSNLTERSNGSDAPSLHHKDRGGRNSQRAVSEPEGESRQNTTASFGPSADSSSPQTDCTQREAERREEILAAATALFAEQGYSDAVTQALADRLQVGKGTIYRYFPSKQALFLAAADRVMRKMRQYVDEKVAGCDGLERVRKGIEAFLTFFAENPQLVELLIQERAHFKDRPKPTYLIHKDVNVERWRVLYRSLIAQGVIRDIPVERITDVISDLLYGTMFTNFFAGQRRPTSAQTQDILDVVLFGILSERERRNSATYAPDGQDNDPGSPPG
jgi:AcrR family transcriptional regulator